MQGEYEVIPFFSFTEPYWLREFNSAVKSISKRFSFKTLLCHHYDLCFICKGYGKLGNLGQVIGYFESLGIPFASMQAPFVALIEMMGGIALILGVGTRLFSFLLANTMIVALLTAHIEDIKVFSDVFKIYEFVYILVFLFLIFKGAGSISLDNLIIKKYNK